MMTGLAKLSICVLVLGLGAPLPAQQGPTVRNLPQADDQASWPEWWQLNRDSMMRVRSFVLIGPPGPDDFGWDWRWRRRRSLEPSSEELTQQILPALKNTLDATTSPVVQTAGMMALAKIGRDHPDFKLRDVFAPRLLAVEQEVREVAALALGVAGIAGKQELDLLAGLALDDETGRAASGGAVSLRTRCFALYGLGLLAYDSRNDTVQERTHAACAAILANAQSLGRNLQTAAIHGMSLLNVRADSAGGATLSRKALATLERFFLESDDADKSLAQAHVPTAIAKLLGRDHPDATRYKKLFAAELHGDGKNARKDDRIAQSCAIALGQLARPYERKKDEDAVYSKLLLDVFHSERDAQTRHSAILGLGWIAGHHNRVVLLEAFERCKADDLPWCALALGVFSRQTYERQMEMDRSFTPEDFLGAALLERFQKATTAEARGALAIGLGLNRYEQAADDLRRALVRSTAREELAGHLANGLALMNDTGAVEDLRHVVANSPRRFTLIEQASIALGRLGDKHAPLRLHEMIAANGGNLARVAASSNALGFIGDRRSVAPLLGFLKEEHNNLLRAFFLATLGSIAARESLPWNAKIARHTNYRATVETLINGDTGVLDFQ